MGFGVKAAAKRIKSNRERGPHRGQEGQEAVEVVEENGLQGRRLGPGRAALRGGQKHGGQSTVVKVERAAEEGRNTASRAAASGRVAPPCGWSKNTLRSKVGRGQRAVALPWAC